MNQTAKNARRHTAQRARKAPARKKEETPALLLGNLVKSALITIGVGITLTVVMSLCAYFYADPDAIILPLALIAAALTAIIGGIVAIRLHGHSALLCGLCNGVIVTCVMLLVSLLFKSYASGYSALVSALLHAAFLLLSVAGAYLGQKRGRQKAKRRR